jgi:hypothetical protein
MDKKSALEILGRFKKSLESRQIKIDKLILVGWFANETRIRDGSDIEVVVISKDFTGKDFWQRTDNLSQAIY